MSLCTSHVSDINDAKDCSVFGYNTEGYNKIVLVRVNLILSLKASL